MGQTTNTKNVQFSAFQTLKKTRFFKDIEDTIVTRFADQAHVKFYHKGEHVFLHDDEAKYFYVVAKGWVKLFRDTLDGKEAIIDVLNDYHIIGESTLFELKTYPCNASVVEDSWLISIPLNVLEAEMSTNHDFTIQMFRLINQIRHHQELELEHRDLQNAPQRIGCFLLRLCPIDQTKNIHLHLPYDKTLIASRLGMKPETFSRALKSLRMETAINVRGATVEIPDLQPLVHYSCSVCSSSFPCQDRS